MARRVLTAAAMRILRPVLLATVAIGALVTGAACVDGQAPSFGFAANINFPNVPIPMTFVAEDAEASIFEDDDLNIDVIQVYAYEDSAGSGIFLQFPAAMAVSAGTYALDPAADPAIKGWFATSDERDDDDLRWQFALHHATLVVITPATQEDQVIAVAVSNAAFVFENEDGLQNPAVTALVAGTNPPISAELDDDAIIDCD